MGLESYGQIGQIRSFNQNSLFYNHFSNNVRKFSTHNNYQTNNQISNSLIVDNNLTPDQNISLCKIIKIKISRVQID